jgi:hypothetical protein
MGLLGDAWPGNAILNNIRAAMDPSVLFMPPIAQIGFGLEMIKTAESVQQIESMQANVRQMQAQRIVQQGGANTNLDSLQRTVIYRWVQFLGRLAPIIILGGITLLVMGITTNKLEWINKPAAAVIAALVAFMIMILFIVWGPESVRNRMSYSLTGMSASTMFAAIVGGIVYMVWP